MVVVEFHIAQAHGKFDGSRATTGILSTIDAMAVETTAAAEASSCAMELEE